MDKNANALEEGPYCTKLIIFGNSLHTRICYC